MRYTIGCEMEDKKGKEPTFHGIVAYGTLGFSFVMTEEHDIDKEVDIMVFDDRKTAEDYVGLLARCYRRDDVAFRPSLKSRRIRKFYLIKVDSAKFPYKIKPTNKTVYVERNRFNEKLSKKVGKYTYYKVFAHK